MDILGFSRVLRTQSLPVFSAGDMEVLFPKANRRLLALQLHQWTRKGWLLRLKRGIYELAFPEPAAVPDMHLANLLYQPSYISLETAMSHWQIIPEFAAQVTSVATKPTRRLRNRHGLFTYSTVRPRAFAGYRVIAVQGFPVRMADPEKALVDWLYARLRRGEKPDLVQERLDRRKLRGLNRRKLREYAGLFGVAGEKLRRWINALAG